MENTSSTHFGEHLTLDGYGGNYGKLNSKELVETCLFELPEKLQMKRLSEPVVYFAPENDIKDPGGWSGFVVIAESHISIHTFPKRGFVSIDAYTCTNGLDQTFIKEYFVEKFDLKDSEINFLIRGTKYPQVNIQ